MELCSLFQEQILGMRWLNESAALDRPHTGRCWHAPLQPAAVCRWQS